MTLRAAFLACVLAASAARADDPPPVPAAVAAAAAYECCVTMTNGHAWTGVVRVADGWEKRAERGEWKVCAKTDPAASVRLWYVAGREGFLVLPAADVKGMEKLGDLDDAALKRLADKAAAAERQAQAERDRLRKERDKPKPDSSKTGKDAKSADASKSDPAAAAKSGPELLAKFPPPAWSAARRDEIEKRRLVQHVEPSAEEREFVDEFGEWAKAMAAATAAPAAKPPAAGPGK